MLESLSACLAFVWPHFVGYAFGLLYICVISGGYGDGIIGCVCADIAVAKVVVDVGGDGVCVVVVIVIDNGRRMIMMIVIMMVVM